MRKSFSKFAFSVSVMLAMAFTFGCSSDDDKGGWVTCSEFHKLAEDCENKFESEYNACMGNSDCEDRVAEREGKCFSDGACNGTDKYTCEEHYDKEGCFDD